MKTIQEFLEKQINGELILAVLSGSRKKEVPTRVRIRPVELKGQILYQASSTVGQKVLHKNYTREELISYMENCLEGTYSQLQVQGQHMDGTVLVSKKGKQTIKIKPHEVREPVRILSHNRVKQYILPEGKPVPFLVDLGVMNKEGRIHASAYDKYRQINRFLEFIEDVLPSLPKDRELNIIDFGCGKSYLTFAMYHYLKVLKEYPVRIIGLDLKQDVINHCSRLAMQYGYEGLDFYHGDIASYEGVDHVDMVVTLHACDTATDFALKKAVDWGAKVILSVPCCQHELAKQISCDIQKPVLQYGLIKERMAALYTDAIRAQVLERCGYRTQILEFIDMEHTPKNILIRGIRQGRKAANEGQLKELLGFLGITPAAVRLLAPELCTDET